MEVRPGYKQTELGVIPVEWEVTPIGQIASIRTGPFGTLLKASEYSENGVPLISVGEIREGFLRITDDTPRVSDEITRRLPRYVLRTGDIVFGRKGGVERSALIRQEQDGWFLGSDGIAVRPGKEIKNEYLAAQFRSARIRGWLLQNAIGTTMPSLNQGVLRRVVVPIPTTEDEQEAIANALSDADALLGALERLIAKKRHLKQATMQQLLTGQTRLPGFHGEWEMRTLGEVFFISTGQSKSKNVVPDGDYWIVDMGSVSIHGELIVSKQTDFCGDFLRRGDLVMPKDDIGGGNIIGKVGYVSADSKYVLGDHVYVLAAKQGDPRFLAYLINSHAINSTLRRKVIGSAQLGLGRRSVEEQEIPFPDPAEQTAIADVLTDMDVELAALERRLAKIRDIKQAMMQQLLTGKIRLFSPEAPHA